MMSSRRKTSAGSATPAKRSLTKMQRYRARLRADGLRPIQIWVPDTRSPDFARQMRVQSLRASRHPLDAETLDFIEAITADEFER